MQLSFNDNNRVQALQKYQNNTSNNYIINI